MKDTKELHISELNSARKHHECEVQFGPPAILRGAEITPVFLFSSFRASSTWFWSKLRMSKKTMAFYEIFNEILQNISVETAHGTSSSSWDSRHPELAPYFLEYLPFIQEGGGVLGYKPAMAYNNFIPADGLDGELSWDEEFYVSSLLNYALASNKIPVISCTRSVGRVRAFRKKFVGKFILLYRNLFHQWASLSGHALAGNSYFISKINLVFSCCSHDPFIRDLDRWFSEREESAENEMMFQAFLLMQLYFYGQAYDNSDLTVDATAIAKDPDLRIMVEQELSEMVRSKICLADCGLHFDQFAVAVKSPVRFIDSVEQFTKLITRELSPQAAAFVEQMKDSALEEWKICDFFTKKQRSMFYDRLTNANKSIISSLDKEAQLIAENDKKQEELLCLRSTVDELNDNLFRERSDNSNLRFKLSQGEAEIVRLTNECERLRKKLTSIDLNHSDEIEQQTACLFVQGDQASHIAEPGVIEKEND